MTARTAEEIVPTLKGLSPEDLLAEVNKNMALLEVPEPPMSVAAQYAARDAKELYKLFLQSPHPLFAADVISRVEDFVVFYINEVKL